MTDADFSDLVNALEDEAERQFPGAKIKIELSDPDKDHRSFSIARGGEKRWLVDVQTYPYSR